MSSNNASYLAFNKPVAARVIRELNTAFAADEQPNRAFYESATVVQIDCPAGIEVDIVDKVLDRYNGVYGTEWFQAPPAQE